MFHGTADKHVPYEFITQATTLLKEKGVREVMDCEAQIEQVELNTYPAVKHKITRRMIDVTRLFLEEKLGN